MITTNNLNQLLTKLKFQQENEVWTKAFPSLCCSLSVDFSKKILIYPENIQGRERNTTFDAPENFVVFECVCRLLSKGYRPEHIILEKEWHLGHDTKSGRADICITTPDENMLLIIECKTYGKEYDKALKDTKSDGGQLFSYWQQEGSTKWLMLYSADYDSESNELIHKSAVINCSDDENIVLLAKTDKAIKLFADAHTTYEKYEVWKETYESKLHDDLIFSDDSVAYKIGVKPLRKRDLLDFKPEDSIVNQFEEILRHNNVSDKENAFNRLIALFICKLVDESKKGEDDEVEFQYKQGTDTYETLQDRLQRLHRDGMDNFMHEDVFYIEPDYPEHLFQQYTGSARKRAVEDLKRTIRCLKYYSNNDFAFKDVHNEELFYQNGKILVEMVQLFEKYRIVYTSKHQFLGDLFEQLLNKGFKQNEGQFFTPMPITRFIWDSLPIESKICTEHGIVYPKVIDYACGAGHFLTEAIEAINFYANRDGNNDWVRNHIYGIEKDYRLARVAKISLFMNGAGEGNIIFGDGLENESDKAIDNGTFDILVANPPYSVKYFKQHLVLKNNRFELLNKIGKDGKEIEVLFVERIAQLLKPNGIAAVILPSSILSNDSSCYIGAREEFFKHFYIRAIVAFGSKTFGATGTNTVVMFLEKYNEPPKRMQIMADTVESILDGKDLNDWIDKKVFERYTEIIEVTQEQYRKFTQKQLSLEDFKDDAYFKMYVKAFADSPEAKNLIKTKTFKNMKPEKQKEVYLQKLYDFIRNTEGEKIYYFSLSFEQKTIIIQAPADNKAQKEFLGYDWSNRKGNEGIVITKAGGRMYNDSDRKDNSTVAALIRQSFDNVATIVSDEQAAYSSLVDTYDMLDFSRETFNKAIKIMVSKKVEITSKYPVVPLGNVVDVRIGGTPSRSNTAYFTGKNLWVSISEMNGQIITDTKEKITDEAVKNSNVKLVPKGTTLLSFKLSIGKTAVAGADLYTNEAIAALVPISNNVKNEYLFALFSGHLIDLHNVGDKAFGKSLNSTYLKNEVKIPIPPMSVQQSIIDECKKIKAEYDTTRMDIDEYHKKAEELFDNLDIIAKTGGYRLIKLSDVCDFNISKSEISEIADDTPVSFIEMASVSNDGHITNQVTKSLSDVKNGGYTYFAEGDILIAKITPCMENGKCAVATGLKNGIGFGSSEFHTFRCKADILNKYLFGYLNRSEIRKKAEAVMTGASGHRRVPISFYEYLMIPLPSIEVQEDIIAQATVLEKKITESQDKLAKLSGKSSDILKKFLK
ncbi:MAG: N-6 DNA methylase [Ruminococcus sp.]|nr:N-6 DNA methylase [Ruminococcus sp.]